MKPFSLVIVIALLAVLSTGCSKSPESKPTSASSTDAKIAATGIEHTHGAGPNGGVVFDLGSHHAEFTVDHGKNECMILVLGDDEKTPTPVATNELVLLTKETKTGEGKAVAPMTITMKAGDTANGKATKFVGTDPGLGNVADFAGTVAGEIDGKPSQGEFKE